MMKKWGLIFGLGIFLMAASVGAEEGEAIFKSQGCYSCHKAGGSGISPSLKTISETYLNKEDRLMSYLKGEAEPIINPDMAGMMHRYIQKTKSLSDEERKALADFIMGHKN
jgi:cytochrome c551/c552